MIISQVSLLRQTLETKKNDINSEPLSIAILYSLFFFRLVCLFVCLFVRSSVRTCVRSFVVCLLVFLFCLLLSFCWFVCFIYVLCFICFVSSFRSLVVCLFVFCFAFCWVVCYFVCFICLLCTKLKSVHVHVEYGTRCIVLWVYIVFFLKPHITIAFIKIVCTSIQTETISS